MEMLSWWTRWRNAEQWRNADGATSKSVESSDGATQNNDTATQMAQREYVLVHSRNDSFQFQQTFGINVALDSRHKYAKVNACVIHADGNGESQREHVVLSRVGMGMSRCAWHAQS